MLSLALEMVQSGLIPATWARFRRAPGDFPPFAAERGWAHIARHPEGSDRWLDATFRRGLLTRTAACKLRTATCLPAQACIASA
jgi:hypothetical protein